MNSMWSPATCAERRRFVMTERQRCAYELSLAVALGLVLLIAGWAMIVVGAAL